MTGAFNVLLFQFQTFCKGIINILTIMIIDCGTSVVQLEKNLRMVTGGLVGMSSS